mmetsp:Transcript_28722/g.43377  ORF Transcript_28722/g.43377 Transcript_28722/m.43377 type:complete len:118 (+) Transcript_28722:1052-1405(+)
MGSQFSELLGLIEGKAPRTEIEILKQDIGSKLPSHEFELFVTQASNRETEGHQKGDRMQKDFDSFVDTVQQELSSLKNLAMSSIEKKADSSLIERQMEALQIEISHLKAEEAQLRQG